MDWRANLRLARDVFAGRSFRGIPSRGRRPRDYRLEGLEPRQVPAALAPAVVMDSATTVDSHSVTIQYDVNTPPDSSHPLTFGVYRSPDATFNAGDVVVDADALTVSGPGSASPTLDDAGQPATAVGHHTLTIPLPDGLPLNPENPYVLVVANPDEALASGEASATASFRKYTIGVVTHGGIQDKNWKNGPPWQLQTGYFLRQDGYDVVIPYNWVDQSSTPGEAAKQAPKLERQIRNALAKLPADAPVDIQLIGHSEGTIVNGQTLLRLGKDMPAQLQAGWIEDTLLDPHAANTGAAGKQYSVAGNPIGWIAKGLIDNYQSKAKDPLPIVPDFVDQAQVFYQQTPASRDHGTNSHIYNLWGQVPVKGKADYFNLTAAGATHSGDTGVAKWYMRVVAPTLGDGGTAIERDVLTGGLSHSSGVVNPTESVSTVSSPTYSGTSAPGSKVYLFLAPAHEPTDLVPVGKAVADSQGAWSLTTVHPLHDGRYRTYAVAVLPRDAKPRFAMVPTTPMGPLVVASGKATGGLQM